MNSSSCKAFSYGLLSDSSKTGGNSCTELSCVLQETESRHDKQKRERERGEKGVKEKRKAKRIQTRIFNFIKTMKKLGEDGYPECGRGEVFLGL